MCMYYVLTIYISSSSSFTPKTKKTAKNLGIIRKELKFKFFKYAYKPPNTVSAFCTNKPPLFCPKSPQLSCIIQNNSTIRKRRENYKRRRCGFSKLNLILISSSHCIYKFWEDICFFTMNLNMKTKKKL